MMALKGVGMAITELDLELGCNWGLEFGENWISWVRILWDRV